MSWYIAYGVVAVVWAVFYTLICWTWSKREFKSVTSKDHPEPLDAALGTLYGLMWPLSVPLGLAWMLVWGIARIANSAVKR